MNKPTFYPLGINDFEMKLYNLKGLYPRIDNLLTLFFFIYFYSKKYTITVFMKMHILEIKAIS
jgi:hypothetical protein